MEGGLKTRLCGPFCPPGSAHYEYFSKSVRSSRFADALSDKPFKNAFQPSAELLRRMDEEQAAYDAGEKDWVR